MRPSLQIASFVSLALAGFAIADPPKPATPATRPAAAARVAPRASNIALDDFFDQLRSAGLNVQVNWAALESVGVDRAAPVNLKLTGVTLRTLLNYALRQVGSDTLAWYVDDGVVYVTTKAISDRQLVTKVFPVGDLLVEVPDFQAPSVQLSNTGTGGTNGGGGGASQSIFGNGNNNSNNTRRTTVAERGEKLCELIRSTIRPEVWVENGGTASIRYYNGNLVVTAPRDVIDKIGK